jgi:hypothetical protein
MGKSKSITKVLEEAKSWMNIPGVEGVGQGLQDNTDCIVVFVSTNPSELKGKIPAKFNGFPVRIEETGHFQVQ